MANAAAKVWTAAPATAEEARPPVNVTPQVLALGDGPVAWADSPARQLHARLAATFVAPPPPMDDTLSPRVKLAIMLGSAAFLWVLVIAAVAAIR